MSYTVEQGTSGHIVRDEDGDRIARISSFRLDSTTELVSYDGSGLMTPGGARAIARALLAVADEMDART